MGGHALCSNLFGATRQSPVGPDEMAGVALRKSLEVILMLRFGLPELACRNDFGHNLGGPQARSIDIGDRVFGNPLLLVAGGEDRGSIAGPDVVALAIARAWVVNLEEELEDLSIADAGWIKDDLDCFGVSVMTAIGRVGAGAARVADPGRQNAVVAADEVLHAPEAASGKNGAFLCHWNHSLGSGKPHNPRPPSGRDG